MVGARRLRRWQRPRSGWRPPMDERLESIGLFGGHDSRTLGGPIRPNRMLGASPTNAAFPQGLGRRDVREQPNRFRFVGTTEQGVGDELVGPTHMGNESEQCF